RGPDGCALVVTSPFRGARSLRRLAHRSVRTAARQLRKAGRDREDVGRATHDARVATRRLAAALDVFGGLLDAPSAARVDRALRSLRRRLGPARDADVARDLLESLTGEEPNSPGAVVARD